MSLGSECHEGEDQASLEDELESSLGLLWLWHRRETEEEGEEEAVCSPSGDGGQDLVEAQRYQQSKTNTVKRHGRRKKKIYIELLMVLST